MNREIINKAIGLQWKFYEKAIGNYSIIIKLLSYINENSKFMEKASVAFVEETQFDTCKIVLNNNNDITKESFYSIISTRDDISLKTIEVLSGSSLSPSLLHSINGYKQFYIYPLKKNLDRIGFLVLGRHSQKVLSMHVLKDLEMICDIFNELVLININSKNDTTSDSVFFKEVIGNMPDPLLLIDTNNIICYANKKALEEFSDISKSFIGKKVNSIFLNIPEVFREMKVPFFGNIYYPSSEKYNIYQISGYPVQKSDETLNLYGLILKNVSKDEFTHNKQLLNERVESLSLLAGGIAHDLNNILTSVLGYTSLLRNFLHDDPKLFRYTEVIEHSAQRAAKLTRHLLNFSRRQKKPSGIVDINALLDDLLFLFKESFRDIEIRTSFCDFLPPVSGDEADLQNVFMNVCINAKDAMDGKGVLTVVTERKESIDGIDFVMIKFKDTGKGISKNIKPRIFEPYFTTKENSRNAGIGLYMVNKTVREYGGFIEVDSEQDKGTTFSIYLPLSIDSIQKKEPDKKAEKRRLSGKTILIVDDEDIIREFMKAILVEENARVLEASNGTEAINIFKKYRKEIDLIILDIIMPGIKGDEVVRVIKEIHPEAKIIVSSGYMDEERRNKLKDYGIEIFLDKPFRNIDVIDKIKEVLSG